MSTCNEMAFFPANFILHQSNPHHQHHDDHDQHHHHHHHQPSASLSPLLPPCSSQDFHGVASSYIGKRPPKMTFPGINSDHVADLEAANGGCGGEDELSDDGSQASENKKRRLNMEQVKTLEKNFELGNKLEPERKMQLAKALGLQPRQIAIWFQNRRARWKTKQLEKDFELLKRQYEAVKADNDSLQAQNQKLQAEIMALKSRSDFNITESINLNIKETDQGSCSNRSSENSSAEIKLDISRTPAAIDSPLSDNNNHHHHHQPLISRHFFPSSSSTASPSPSSIRPSTTTATAPANTTGVITQVLFQCGQKNNNNNSIHHHPHMGKEESLSNMFCGMDDQSGFWPWLEQQQFN